MQTRIEPAGHGSVAPGPEARRQLRAGVLPPGGRQRLADRQVYERASLGGGLGYSEHHLRGLWDSSRFSVRVLRQMTKTDGQGPYFGEEFLWALLATRDVAIRP